MIFLLKTGGYRGQYEERWLIKGSGAKAQVVHEWSHSLSDGAPSTFGKSTYTVQEFLQSNLDRDAVSALEERLKLNLGETKDLASSPSQ